MPPRPRGGGRGGQGRLHVGGQSVSFIVAGVLIAGAGNLSRAVLVLSAGPLVAAGLIARYFPETGGRELEQIAPPSQSPGPRPPSTAAS